jgi:sortase (surface protein transpeptidase)
MLVFHKFKLISLSFESPFMHIKHLKHSRQIMFLDLNVLFVYQMCTIHS